MADTTSERNLKPTAKRIREARRRGQIARSRDLAAAFGLVAATGMLGAFGGTLMHRLSALVVRSLEGLDRAARASMSAEELSSLVLSSGTVFALTVGPVALAAAVAGVAVSFAQGGFSVSTEPLVPDLTRLNPVNGLRRLKPSQSGIDTLKTIVAAVVLSVIAWRIGREFAADVPRLAGAQVPSSAGRGWELVMRLLWQVGAALVALGAADYAIQRWRLMSSLKMTRQEMTEELRSDEGRPEVKARVRRIQRDMVRRRMLHAAATATVVITNPTHYAVALEYRRDKSPAPVVVAKGRNLLAGRIREIARLNNVPIVENPPLARALYSGAEVGDMVPVPLFGAVAEVLAYLVRIRQLLL
jgi:flagellar biosynthesis protein FlhB